MTTEKDRLQVDPGILQKPDPKVKAALKILRVLNQYPEDNNLKLVAKNVDEIIRLLK